LDLHQFHLPSCQSTQSTKSLTYVGINFSVASTLSFKNSAFKKLSAAMLGQIIYYLEFFTHHPCKILAVVTSHHENNNIRNTLCISCAWFFPVLQVFYIWVHKKCCKTVAGF